MRPTFAVVIPAFNEERYVADAVESVLAQTYQGFEVIVVDDGSSDRTAEVIRPFERTDPRVRLITQDNAGLSAARNTGIAATEAELIAFLDSDDLFMPTYLERVGETFDSHPEAGFVYCDAWWLEEPTGRFYRNSAMVRQDPPSAPAANPHEFLLALIRKNFVFAWASVRRTALDAVGVFDTSLTACEDYDLWIRLLARDFGAAQAPGQLAIQRDRRGSMSWNQTNMRENLKRVYRATIEDYSAPPDVCEIARRQIDELDRELAAYAGHAPATSAWWALRGRLGRLRKLVLSRRIWHSTPPQEVQAAFPHLFGDASSGH